MPKAFTIILGNTQTIISIIYGVSIIPYKFICFIIFSYFSKLHSFENLTGLKIQDFKNNEYWKIKQGLVFTIIQISSNCFSDTLASFCQKVLIQLWVQEKDLRVKNLLKNEKVMSMQMRILQKDWQTQQDRIAGEMQKMLSRIDELQEQISHEANLNKLDIYLKQLDETKEQLDQQIVNISEMGQQLRLLTDFINHIRKGLIRMEGKINEMKEQLKIMGNDIKFLRGKSVEQLFEIRKWKVLKEAALKNAKSIYIPLITKEIYHKDEKQDDKLSILINLEQINDIQGEVNQFLLEGKETVWIWLRKQKNLFGNYIIKIQKLEIKFSYLFISPYPLQKFLYFKRQRKHFIKMNNQKSAKRFQRSKNSNCYCQWISYDEMKLENIQKNLYMIKKVKQYWSLVTFTTRSEIFTSSNYSLWFAPEKKENLKEIQYYLIS
ncbi:unnamed protein product [Paramecium octaurelia]|uniref:Transmembrane protein n=1 Tax=Paramecium octaurelia TaxID=43137 RepID=A0A8S1YNM1_PAROT|nr:unnamed protein product [Paramecium octaurelia]